MGTDNQWADAQRLESWAGEARVNLIRLAAILVFYGNHLVDYFGGDNPGRTAQYHVAATLVVMAWSLAVLGLYWCLSRRWLPPALKYAATAWDTLLLTALLLLGQDPRTTLAVLYFLIIGAAGLRLSLPLIWAATLGSMAAYAIFLGYVKYYLELPAEQRVPRAQQLIFLLALGAAGILTGQFVRQARRLVRGYPVTVKEGSEG